MSQQKIKENLRLFSEQIDALRRRTQQHATQETDSVSDIDALKEALDDLSLSLEELQVADEELRQQNEEINTARLQIEHQRQRYLDLFEFAPDAYLVTTLEGTIQEANRAAGKLFAIEPRFLLGKPLTAFVASAERRAFRQQLVNLQTSNPIDEWEVRMLLRDGMSFDAQITIAVARATSETPTSLRWMIRDITERKQQLARITELNAQLEQRVQERTARLEAETKAKEAALLKERAARTEAERANALKLQFLAMISHELRTPLTTIKGFASTLLATDVHFSEADQRDFIELIEEESDRLTELVEQLIDLARLKGGTLSIRTEALPVTTILRLAQARMETLAEAHRLTVEAQENLPPIRADGQRVAQVLVNLVGNSAKFSPPGTGILLRIRVSANEAQFDVEDEGPGIPLEKQAFVFEAFHQLEPSGSGKRGAGLGLAICKELIEAQGGRIWIADHRTAGTTISFTLPLVS